MNSHLSALKLCLRVSFPALAFLLFGSFPSRQTCLHACPCVYVCTRVCASVCVCVVGELHGFSKEEEVEASVNDVSPLADRGPPSSILKDCFRTWVTKESGAPPPFTHIPSSPVASTENGGKKISREIFRSLVSWRFSTSWSFWSSEYVSRHFAIRLMTFIRTL